MSKSDRQCEPLLGGERIAVPRPAFGRRSMLFAAPALALAGRARAAAATLRVGDQKGGTRSVMQAAGVLDSLPYRLEWSQFPAAAPLLEALNADAVDAGYAGDAPTIFAVAAGLRGRVIAAIRANPAGTAILVPKASTINSAADLKGRSIATNRGSIGQALLLALTSAQGWAPNDLTMVNLLPAEAKTALSAGSVDAWCSWGVYVAQALLVDQARVVVDGGHGLFDRMSYLTASDPAIAARRPALLDFSRRLAAARRWALAHPDEYARALAAEIGVSQPVARLTFDLETPDPVAVDDRVVADAQRTADLLFRGKLLHARLDAKAMFDPSFNEALAG